ncbi:hypothetical protein IEO21_01004 [Rhodonia placenta]|uniref:Uncharacterized protein n=1 Tax=Rhodonia placenta TaxID=104341 RepID=A0A8H7U5T8_9APHY|nr:hypothetical protein IEO21_01004 [Postia placenta]
MSVAGLHKGPIHELLSEESDSNGAAVRLRPNIARRDTDNILSYYQSEHAGRTYSAFNAAESVPAESIMREASPHGHPGSRSSSEYSDSDFDHHVDAGTHGSHPQPETSTARDTGHTRRPSIPSEGGADRRRLAIVELDSTLPASLSRKRSQGGRDVGADAGSASVTSTILSRRGIHVDGLALVAPPDASPRAYTNLTPPSTAPLSFDRAPVSSSPALHQRSMSEAKSATPLHRRKSSRDVGIVGVVPPTSELTERGIPRGQHGYAASLKVPIFQTPAESPSQSPGHTPEGFESSTLGVFGGNPSALTTPDTEGRKQEMLTPAIGESKEISQPVVGPVVVGITAGMMRKTPGPGHGGSTDVANTSAGMTSPGDTFAVHQNHYRESSRSGSPYVSYEPGVHSTAGPLPPPPQPALDLNTLVSTAPAPARPPRAYTPSQPISQVGRYNALRDALQLPREVSDALASITSREPSRSRTDLQEGSAHSREGAQSDTGSSKPLTKSRSMHVREGAHPPSTVVNTPATSDASVLHAEITDSTSTMLRRDESVVSDKDTPPPISEHPLRTQQSGLELRRKSSWVSLTQAERTASPNAGAGKVPSVSVSCSSTSCHSHSTFSHIPSPPPKNTRGSPATDNERSSPMSPESGPSNNPLRGNGTRSAQTSALRLTVTPATPSTRAVAETPRHTSHGSTTTEATFPIRPDAYSATDLSTRPIDIVSNALPSTLPYPSLAQSQSSRASLRSSTLVTTPARSFLALPGGKSGGGFFSSIGRKASVRKDRPALPPVSPSRVLSKRNPNTSYPPPTPVPAAPLVPGGPRAAPGRIQRSQTFSVATSPPKDPSPPSANNARPNRQSSMARRPSLFARARGQGQTQVAQTPSAPDPDFERQVDKLADLLPHADRDVLAGYLRRAGQDILAIGQFLEDEKNGTLLRD